MWDEYSDKHRGFCIGFDTKKMCELSDRCGPVIYFDKLPEILPSDSHHIEIFKQVFSKEIKWEHEKEYRMQRFYPNSATDAHRRIKLPKGCYKVIILGAKQSDEHKQEIISICKSQGLPVEFYIETINDNNEITINKMTNSP